MRDEDVWRPSVQHRGVHRQKGGVVTQTTEYYPAVEKNEIVPLTTTWIGLEAVILRQVSQRKTMS